MRAKGIFISALLVIDTFLVSYAVGFNSRQVLVVDPALAPLTPPPAAPAGKKDKPAPAAPAGKKKPASGAKAEHDRGPTSSKRSTAAAASRSRRRQICWQYERVLWLEM